MTMITRNVRSLSLAVIAVLCTSCFASTRRGEATIVEVDGLPCFSVPATHETRRGVPLDTLMVTERHNPKESGRPKIVWSFNVYPPGSTILLLPENCIKYGILPPQTEQSEFEYLQPYRIYTVALHAVPARSNLRGYSAEFCIKLATNGKHTLQIVPWDETSSKWQYEVCARP